MDRHGSITRIGTAQRGGREGGREGGKKEGALIKRGRPIVTTQTYTPPIYADTSTHPPTYSYVQQ